MNKAISKAIMLGTKLISGLVKYSATANITFYSKQRNFCVSLLRKETKKYFATLNIKKEQTTKHFGKL